MKNRTPAPLRVAIIGAGYFARLHINAWRRLSSVELVAVVDLNLDAAKDAAGPDVAAFDDANTMLNTIKPDLVDIATPPASHEELVRLVASEGIDAICQKPVAPDLSGAERIVDIARASGTRLIIHENIRFMPWYRECRKLLDSGAVGTVTNLTMRLRPGDGQGPDAYLERQPYFQQMPRFLVHETAIHWIDVFRYLAGECTGVFARLRKLNPAIAGEDAGAIVFDFADGVTGLFDGNRLVDHESDNPRRTMGETLIEGTDGAIRVDGSGRVFRRRKGEREQEHTYEWVDEDFGGDCVFNFQQHVVDHITTGSPIENTAELYLTNVELEELIYRSHEEGRFLTYTP